MPKLFKNYSKRQQNRLIKKKITQCSELAKLEVRLKNHKFNHNNVDACSSTSASTSTSVPATAIASNTDIIEAYVANPIVDTMVDLDEYAMSNEENANSDSDEDTNLFAKPQEYTVCSEENSNSDSEEDTSLLAEPQEFLRKWALDNNLTHTSVTQLLTWLRSDPQNLSSLPSDARTLLRTPRTVTLDVMADCGKFYYFGLEKNLVQIANKYSDIPDKLKLQFNIDGLPIHKSKSTSF